MDTIERPNENSAQTPDKVDAGRREAIGKLGRFMGYTAPAMLVLLTAEKAMARSGRDGKPGHGGQDRN